MLRVNPLLRSAHALQGAPAYSLRDFPGRPLSRVPGADHPHSAIWNLGVPALARQLNRYSPSRRDPAEGRVNFSPAEKAGLKPSALRGKPKSVACGRGCRGVPPIAGLEPARGRVADPPLQASPYDSRRSPPRGKEPRWGFEGELRRE